MYEIIKTIYSTQASESDDSTRISVIQNTLGQLRLANIATLDAITTHFTRLIELTSADETYISSLASTLAPCILRPRMESSLTPHERYSYRLLRDLLAHKEAIFGELKRASSSNSIRSRAISTNESNRRANMEARAQAIASKSRATSPQPHSSRGHRRDRSPGSASTRFPIQTSPPEKLERRTTRQSLEVPISDGITSNSDAESDKPVEPNLNGTTERADVSESQPTEVASQKSGVDKRNSLGRSAASGKVQRRLQGANSSRHSLPAADKRDSLISTAVEENGEAPQRPVGVTLEDKPLDD